MLIIENREVIVTDWGITTKRGIHVELVDLSYCGILQHIEEGACVARKDWGMDKVIKVDRHGDLMQYNLDGSKQDYNWCIDDVSASDWMVL